MKSWLISYTLGNLIFIKKASGNTAHEAWQKVKGAPAFGVCEFERVEA